MLFAFPRPMPNCVRKWLRAHVDLAQAGFDASVAGPVVACSWPPAEPKPTSERSDDTTPTLGVGTAASAAGAAASPATTGVPTEPSVRLTGPGLAAAGRAAPAPPPILGRPVAPLAAAAPSPLWNSSRRILNTSPLKTPASPRCKPNGDKTVQATVIQREQAAHDQSTAAGGDVCEPVCAHEAQRNRPANATPTAW